MTLHSLVPLPVLLPLLAAAITVVAYRHNLVQRFVSAIALSLGLLIAVVLLWAADDRGPLSVRIGGWGPAHGIVLVVDRLSALMVLISYVVTLAVMLFSIGQGRASTDATDGDAPLPIFHPTLLVLMAGVATTFLSGDLFHMYVGFEMLLFASFVLLTLGGTVSRIRAGINYVIVNLLSSVLFVTAVALIYASTGTVSMALLSERLPDLPPSTQLTLQLMLLLGFCIKAALFPVSAWLPDSYPTAPASVTAIFAGVLTKVGVYAIIRTQTLLFPDGRLNGLLMWAALATMIVGIMGAVAQNDIKRMLSFTLVSHIGYMIFGISVGNLRGLSSAMFYVAHHITIQTTLFLVTGLIERVSGTTSLSRLGGILRSSPLIALLFFIPAMNLSGIPPLSGFLGKVGLMQAGAEAGTPLAYALMGGSALTSLLTLYAISRIWARAFWRAPPTETELAESTGDLGGQAPPTANPMAPGVVLPTAGIMIFSVAFTVFAGPLFAITDRAASEMHERTPYVTAVFGDQVPK